MNLTLIIKSLQAIADLFLFLPNNWKVKSLSDELSDKSLNTLSCLSKYFTIYSIDNISIDSAAWHFEFTIWYHTTNFVSFNL